ncbi:hypothetical protein ACFSCW_04250 [Sphingomonas tabacisoli]|uniref:Uncharacterized protein n=1 Tax=Sphingomonas tabacisoli TaxID=2249466 RepID=A0ABW4HZE1_9SPHN
MNKPVLVCMEKWMCRTCSQLRYRDQAIGSEAAAWEKLDRLSTRVGLGRPKRMHCTTFGALKAELAELQSRLSGERAEASVEHCITVTGNWIHLQEDVVPFRPKSDAERHGLKPFPKPKASFIEMAPGALLIENDDEED